jgi:hypothetical protein
MINSNPFFGKKHSYLIMANPLWAKISAGNGQDDLLGPSYSYADNIT